MIPGAHLSTHTTVNEGPIIQRQLIDGLHRSCWYVEQTFQPGYVRGHVATRPTQLP